MPHHRRLRRGFDSGDAVLMAIITAPSEFAALVEEDKQAWDIRSHLQRRTILNLGQID